MSPKKKLFFSCSITLLLALCDGGLTYLNTPDLSDEGNPLVTVFGLGWEALFIANALAFCLYILAGYYYFFLYHAPHYQAKGFFEYLSLLFFNRPDKPLWLLYRFPKNWAPFWANASYVLLIISPIHRSILVFEWLLETFDIRLKPYSQLRRLTPYGRFDLAVALVLIVFFMCWWLWREYKRNQAASPASPAVA